MSTEVKVQFAATSLKELRQQIMSFLLEDGAIRVVDEAPAQQVMNLVPPQIVEPEVVQPEAKVETAPLEPAQSVAEESTPTASEPSAKDAETSASTELTYEDVRKAVLDLASVTGPEKVKETLATFGLTNAKDADPGLWPQIIEKFVAEAETAKASAAKAKSVNG